MGALEAGATKPGQAGAANGRLGDKAHPSSALTTANDGEYQNGEQRTCTRKTAK